MLVTGPFSLKEDEYIRSNIKLKTLPEMAVELNRNIESVEQRATKHLGLTVKTPKRRIPFSPADVELLIENWAASPTALKGLFKTRRLSAIRRKQQDLVGLMRQGMLSDGQSLKIKKGMEEQSQRDKAKRKRMLAAKELVPAFEQKKLPTLEVGAEYQIKYLGRKEDDKYFRRGKVLSYHPKGCFYLVDYGLYKESICQKMMLIGRTIARRV